MWLNLIDQEYWTEVQKVYQSLQEAPPSVLPAHTEAILSEDITKAFLGPLATLQSPQRIQQVAKLLRYFLHKRPDIGYVRGMASLLALPLSVFAVESSAFGVFAYMLERVFPESYFDKAERCLGKFTELRIFSLLAERLRPHIVQTLKAVFRPRNEPVTLTQARESDYSPFVSTTKRLAEAWFSTLFSSNLYPVDLVRIWDCLLIFGFEFAQKFGLVLLSRYERAVRNAVKEEVAGINQGSTVDALVTAGTAAALRLLKRTDKLPLEKLIRKAISKPSYVTITREQMRSQAESLESSQEERLARLRISRTLFQETDANYDSFVRMFEELEKMKTGEQVSRRMFQAVMRGCGWSEKVALNLFATFDQQGTDSVPIRELQVGISMLSKGNLDDKLTLAFAAFDSAKEGEIDPGSAIALVSALEASLDHRLTAFEELSSALFLSMERTAAGLVSLSGFITAFKASQSVGAILDILEHVESPEILQVTNMRVVDFTRSGDFSNILSPLASSDFAASASDQEDVPDPVDLEARLESLLQNDLKEDLSKDTSNTLEKQWEVRGSELPIDPAEVHFSYESVKGQKLEPIEESKEESEGNRSDHRMDQTPSVKDLNGRSGCSRLCTKDMCRLS